MGTQINPIVGAGTDIYNFFGTVYGDISGAIQGAIQNGKNGLFGNVSSATKQALIDAEVAQLVQAGMSHDEAVQVATADVTGQLMAANADPSQLPWAVQNWKLLLALAGIGLGLYLIAPFARR